MPVFVVREDDMVIYYAPAFDVSGYGYNESEAEQSLRKAINEFQVRCKAMGWGKVTKISEAAS